MDGAGRNTKLTPELQDRIVSYIRGGNYAKTACQAAGIDEATFYRWLERGRNGEEPFCKFCKSIGQARAEAEIRNVFIIQTAAKKSWQAALAWLERVSYKDWGRKEQVAGIKDEPIEFIIRNADEKRD